MGAKQSTTNISTSSPNLQSNTQNRRSNGTASGKWPFPLQCDSLQ